MIYIYIRFEDMEETTMAEAALSKFTLNHPFSVHTHPLKILLS